LSCGGKDGKIEFVLLIYISKAKRMDYEGS